MLDCSEIVGDSKSQSIEKVLHKYELEIRSHIKLEQEFKRMADEAERRLESLKADYNDLGNKYNEMMVKLSDVSYLNDSLADENRQLKQLLKENQLEFQDANKRLSKAQPLSVTREKNFKNNRTTSTEFLKMQVAKLKKTSGTNSSVCAQPDRLTGNSINASKRHGKNSALKRQHLQLQQFGERDAVQGNQERGEQRGQQHFGLEQRVCLLAAPPSTPTAGRATSF